MDKPINISAQALERRVKRRAWGKTQDYFAPCAPGLEKFLALEAAELGLLAVRPEAGGISFRGRLDHAYWACLHLTTAGRVLLRLADFRVRSWQDLVNKARGIPWEAHLPAGAKLAVRVSLAGSNLKHTGRVTEEVLEAAATRLAGLGLAPAEPAGPDDEAFLLLVRGSDRRATISLDLCGQHLHKRGYRLLSGPAPLREDLAAGLLRLAGYKGDCTLFDPMCGSGTLPIEAGILAGNLPAGAGREFAFMRMASFRPATWEHFLGKTREAAVEPSMPILGRDISPQAVAGARQNAARAGLSEAISFERGDFFALPAPDLDPGLLVCNPPFGQRLSNPKEARDLVARLGRKLALDYQGWRVGLVLPNPGWQKLLPLADSRRVMAPHGGLQVCLVSGRVADVLPQSQL